MRKINLIVLIMVIVSCKPVSTTSAQLKSLEAIVTEKLGADAIIQKNKDASFALCTKEKQSTQSVSYMIVRLHDLSIVEEDSTSRATFSWIDNFKIEVKIIPGMVKQDDQTLPVKIIDVSKYMMKL